MTTDDLVRHFSERTPVIPVEWLRTAMEAIAAGRAGDWDREIPSAVDPTVTAPAYFVIDLMGLDNFVSGDSRV